MEFAIWFAIGVELHENAFKLNLFFDFDGTIVDARMRLYKLFCFLAPSADLDFDSYWNLKRDKQSHRNILQRLDYSKNTILLFEKEWMKQIENDEWLAYDELFYGVSDLLEQYRQLGYLVYLVTSRQSTEQLHKQLKQLKIFDLFKIIFKTDHNVCKSVFINKVLVTDPDDWFFGDTGVDIKAGKVLGIHTGAVLSGFRSREVLMGYQPDIILNSVTESAAIILNNE